jgi:hypothetical protein
MLFLELHCIESRLGLAVISRTTALGNATPSLVYEVPAQANEHVRINDARLAQRKLDLESFLLVGSGRHETRK